MTSQPGAQHKVSQPGSDVEALYDLVDNTNKTVTEIATRQRRHGNRLDEIQQSQDLTNGRMDRLEGKLDTILDLLRGRSASDGDPT